MPGMNTASIDVSMQLLLIATHLIIFIVGLCLGARGLRCRPESYTVRHAVWLLRWWADDESDDPRVMEMVQQSEECADELEASLINVRVEIGASES